MSSVDTRQTLNELLVDLFNFILQIEEKYLKDNGVNLTMSEVHIIETVNKIENNTVTSIADALLVTKGTFSVNATKLINKGYLVKFRDKEDGRVVRVEVTDKAREVLKIHSIFHNQLIDKTIEDLNLAENDVLNQSLSSLLKYFKTEYLNMLGK